MFNRLRQSLSSWLWGELSPKDIADLQACASVLVEDITQLRTQVNRIERKVYRDQAAEVAETPGVNPPEVPAAFSWEQLGPGDPVPDNIQV